MGSRCDSLIIGAGFYGLYLATHLAKQGERVIVCEQEVRAMQRASYANQARVHNGYHYPRSVLTALRSRVNFPRFVEDFRDAVDSSFQKIYAIGRQNSKVSASQFATGMKRVGAMIEVAPSEICQLFNDDLVEGVFRVQEYAFNSTILAQLILARCAEQAVEVRYSNTVLAVQPAGTGIEATVQHAGQTTTITANRVFSCTYSRMNAVPVASQIEPVPLKHELTEITLVRVPEVLQSLGITLMDGPFFSCMPFPARGCHSLTHVRYTPHGHWFDRGAATPWPLAEPLNRNRQTAFPSMMRDAARFLPIISRVEYLDSLWEVKTVLPRSEVDDSRPILFRAHHGLRNFHLILGAKIDNIYDVCDAVDRELGREEDR